MNVVDTVRGLRAARAKLGKVTLVPTMGNLHDGHLSLVRQAQASGHPVAVSIFVNPLQFSPSDDFNRYPRTLEEDCEKLRLAGCDLVFAPSPAEMYPAPQSFFVQPAPALADDLEGRARPGFFVGVCTVVLKLFSLVEPSDAIFGKKDYQQLLTIEEMTRQFGLGINIHAGETVREADGLARSSRNGYLSPDERAEGPFLYACLRDAVEQCRRGQTDFTAVEQAATQALSGRSGWTPEYFVVRDRRTLGMPAAGHPMIVLAAARLGSTRLIDNLEI